MKLKTFGDKISILVTIRKYMAQLGFYVGSRPRLNLEEIWTSGILKTR